MNSNEESSAIGVASPTPAKTGWHSLALRPLRQSRSKTDSSCREVEHWFKFKFESGCRATAVTVSGLDVQVALIILA